MGKNILWGRYSPLPLLSELCLVVPLGFISWVSRFSKRKQDVGLGPQPLINNCYHKLALQTQGYTAETFVGSINYITSRYDINLGRKRIDVLPPVWKPAYLFCRALFNYKSLFIYFNGGPLLYTKWLRYLEPYYYRLANLKVVVMPYGSDVQDMRLSPNLYFRHAMSVDYPQYAKLYPMRTKNIDRWTRHADWVISGCEWVDYMTQWDTLQLAHFSIDLEQWHPQPKQPSTTFRVLHAPNHPTIKGTQALMTAVEQLQAEGLDIELMILRGVPNEQIQTVMSQADLVADQFVVGWYAMFALEAMALEKPVLCYLRPDLLEFYTQQGLIEPGEIPIIDTPMLEITDKLRWAYHNREQLEALGKHGRAYVKKHHSIQSIGKTFGNILRQLGIEATHTPAAPLLDNQRLGNQETGAAKALASTGVSR